MFMLTVLSFFGIRIFLNKIRVYSSFEFQRRSISLEIRVLEISVHTMQGFLLPLETLEFLSKCGAFSLTC